jgi:hypothetical protein
MVGVEVVVGEVRVAGRSVPVLVVGDRADGG